MKLRIFLLPIAAICEIASFMVAVIVHLFSVKHALRICDFWLSMPDSEWYWAGWKGGVE